MRGKNRRGLVIKQRARNLLTFLTSIENDAYADYSNAILGIYVFRSSLRYFANNNASSLIKVSIVCLLPTVHAWQFEFELNFYPVTFSLYF